MESAPLTLAHTHARNAALETKRSNPVAASEEHDLAAVEFASAAQGTTDSEAARILTLLEQHHKKLGQILKSHNENPASDQETSHASGLNANVAATPDTETTLLKADVQLANPESAQNPPRLLRPPRPTARDLSSSIASNLATARGIPSSRQRRPLPVSPTVSAQHAGGRFAQDAVTAKQEKDQAASSQTPRPSWTQPRATNADGENQKHEDIEPQSLDSFQQFYNTFESLISKISAPLAFAVLPLSGSSPAKAPPAAVDNNVPSKARTSKPSKRPPPVLAESVDYSQLISSAALRAVRDGAPSAKRYNPAESFYVVPTTGGSMSYAEIMNRAERENSRHKRNLSGISEDGDGFVDAHEQAPALSPKLKKDASGEVKGKTTEELFLENQALKELVDTVSKRLHVFEMSSQSATAAMAQSIRDLQRAHSPLNTPENSGKRRGGDHSNSNSGRGGGSDEKAKKRIAELEEILRKNDKELARRKEENAKLKDVVVKYREKWDKLKEGARARRGDGGGGGGGAAAAVAGGVDRASPSSKPPPDEGSAPV